MGTCMGLYKKPKYTVEVTNHSVETPTTIDLLQATVTTTNSSSRKTALHVKLEGSNHELIEDRVRGSNGGHLTLSIYTKQEGRLAILPRDELVKLYKKASDRITNIIKAPTLGDVEREMIRLMSVADYQQGAMRERGK